MLLVASLVEKLSAALVDKGWKMASAESCTGGMIAAAMTDRAGSSAVFERGFVTYSNESKVELLGVSSETLARYGAVSAQTAAEMACGAVEKSHADVAVSVTGIAGPSGGSVEKPVGLVYIAVACRHAHDSKPEVMECHFEGDRELIRLQSVETALERLIEGTRIGLV